MSAKGWFLLVPAVVLLGCSQAQDPLQPPAGSTAQFSKSAQGGRNHGALGTVYVSSQGLYYDTFVSAEKLPMKGRFQLLDNGVTEFGPGQPGYLGGRWWVDVNDDGMQDAGDMFLLCPLLPPGRPNP